MEPIVLQATDDTPEIILNPEENIFRIARVSVPEDAYEFYQPIIEWVKEYAQHPNDSTEFEFNLEYVNTASNKQLMQLIIALDEVANKSDVKIRWYYEPIDEDMLSLGKRYEKLTKNIEFEFIEI